MPESSAQQQLEPGILMSSTPFPSLGPPLWPVRLLDVGLWLIGAGLLLCLICGPSHRFGLANFRVALLLLAGGLLLLLAGTLLAIVGMLVASARRMRFARGPAMVMIAIGLLASGYLLSWIARARAAPPIHEISTDLADPPAFVVVAALRRDAHAVNPSEYVSRLSAPGGRIIEVPELQRQRYPDIQPLRLRLCRLRSAPRSASAGRSMPTCPGMDASRRPTPAPSSASRTTWWCGCAPAMRVRASTSGRSRGWA